MEFAQDNMDDHQVGYLAPRPTDELGDMKSLFGEDDQDWSLFGENSEGGSVFEEAIDLNMVDSLNAEYSRSGRTEDISPTVGSQANLTRPSTASSQPPVSVLLHLPTIPDPADAFSSHQDGHTSGLHVVSTHNFTSNMTFEEERDLETMMELEFLQDQVVNTSSDSSDEHGDQDGRAQDKVISDDDVEAWREFELLKDRAIKGTTVFDPDKIGESGIGLALQDLPGYSHTAAAASTRRGIRIPRRVDFQMDQLEVLVPYLTVQATLTKGELYQQLGVSKKEGHILAQGIKTYVAKSEHAPLLIHGKAPASPEKRRALLQTAFQLLKTEGWGPKWFGKTGSSKGMRTLCWPQDSTLITCHFAGFINKICKLDRMRRQAMETKLSKASTPIPGTSAHSPIDLSGDDDDVSSTEGAITPTTLSVAADPSVESLSHQTTEQQLSNPSDFNLQSLAISQVVQIPGNLIRPGNQPKQMNPALNSGAMDSNAKITSTESLDAVFREVSLLKTQKLQATAIGRVPADAALEYRFSFLDKDDLQELRPPAVTKNIDDAIFEYLRSSFDSTSTPVTVDVLVDGDWRRITSQQDWDAAVLEVWTLHPRGALVQVLVQL
jgi:hypothetical protein